MTPKALEELKVQPPLWVTCVAWTYKGENAKCWMACLSMLIRPTKIVRYVALIAAYTTQ